MEERNDCVHEPVQEVVWIGLEQELEGLRTICKKCGDTLPAPINNK